LQQKQSVFSLSALCILLQFTPMTIYAAYASGPPYFVVATSYYADALFFNYWIVLLTPFASVMSLPEVRTKFRKLFLFWQRKRAVNPETLAMAR